ncbi:adenylate/guanylate cyclase domain-containing protein [Acuticoccus sediminis]|nr:adenylate/guanylate cyclase domain-containing protein [Acuticoccus sediminis]
MQHALSPCCSVSGAPGAALTQRCGTDWWSTHHHPGDNDSAPSDPADPSAIELTKDVVTVLFTDLEGFTRLTEALPLERTAAILGQYYDALLSVAKATGGRVDRFIGDGAMLYWSRTRHGPPHADRAVAAVGLLREALARQEPHKGDRIAAGLPVRFGVHTGEVMFGQIGAGDTSRTMVGDVVNVAFRLQQAAKALAPRPVDGGLRGYVSRETTRHLTADRPTGTFQILALPGRRHAALAQRM